MDKAKKILIVDDDNSFLETLEQLLTSNGFDASCAINVSDAQKKISTQTFDLVLTDIRMPGASGIDLLNSIKKTTNIPVVLMTGFSAILETIEASKLGADGFLAKPFRKNELLDLLESIFNKNRYAANDAEKKNNFLYCKIPIDDFIWGDEITCPIFVQLSENIYIKIANSALKLDWASIEAYKLKGIYFLYIHHSDFLSLIGGFSTGALKEEISTKFLLNSIKNIEKFQQGALQETRFSRAKDAVESGLVAICEDKILFFSLEHNQSPALFTKTLGTALFTAMIAFETGWTTKRQLVCATINALLHNNRDQNTKPSHNEWYNQRARKTDILALAYVIPLAEKFTQLLTGNEQTPPQQPKQAYDYLVNNTKDNIELDFLKALSLSIK